MSKVDYFFLGSLTAFTIVLAILLGCNYQRPVRVQYVPQKLNCSDIIRYEDGSLVCEININAEDDEIVVQQI